VPGGDEADYIPVMHSSGEYLDIIWKVPTWFRRAERLKKEHVFLWAGHPTHTIMDNNLVSFRATNKEVNDGFPEGQVVRTHREKLPTKVNVDAGFATTEGPQDHAFQNGIVYKGYALAVHQHPTNTAESLNVFRVDMYGARKPNVKKNAPPTKVVVSDAVGDDSDDDAARPPVNRPDAHMGD
jgi:hypothetical protein